MKFLGLNITRDIKEVKNLEVGRRQRSASQRHSDKQKYQMRQDLRTLRLAVENANNTETFNRYELHEIYRQILKDPAMSAQWNTRVLKTLDKEFHLTTIDSSEPDKAAAEMFKAPWFHEWVRSILEMNLWGYSLIEFGPWDEDKKCFKPYMDTEALYHTAIETVDRDYVKPEWGVIVHDYNDGKGIGTPYNYLTSRASERLMFVGTPEKEETILYKCASYMLLKENAMANWSEWAEVFSFDMRVGKTEATGEERKNFNKIMQDMGSNGFAVIDPEDMIEYVGVNRQDAYQVFQYFLDYCDMKIAELIFGQSVVTNNTGRVVGNVGADISNMYGDADAKWVEWMINTMLIPHMNSCGADLEGYTFKYDTTEKVKLTERAKIDKAVADMGYQLTEEYLERTYGVKIEEYIGVPYSMNAAEEKEDKTKQ